MAYYKTNPEKKLIIIDHKEKATEADKAEIAMYLAAGWTIRQKSEKRAANAKGRADGLKAADIQEALKGDKEALNKFNEILHAKKNEGGGYFVAKKWYNKYLAEKKAAEEKK